MKFRQYDQLNEAQVASGLKYIFKEGLAGEGMVNLTGGAFLVSMALHLGASNFQIGLLASMPILTNLFQLVSIWLVQRYQNRKAVTVISSFIARFPLLFAIALPFIFGPATGLQLLIGLLCIHYVFGSIASASWNPWMKDLIPEQQLGTFFSKRTRLVTILSIVAGLGISTTIDFIKDHFPQQLTMAYYVMFLIGAVAGMLGLYWLSRAPETRPEASNENMLKLLGKPLRDYNFRKLLVFQSFWAFSLNLAVPFFTVFMMNTIGLPLSNVIWLTIIGQLCCIISVKAWGRYSDRFSNKTIINICAPAYVVCILAWAFAALPGSKAYSIMLLVIISAVSGIATAGINLALNNIGMKLAPRQEAISYLTVRSIIVSLFSALAPIIGGLMADFFATHELIWNIQWQSEGALTQLKLIDLKGWNFLFLIGGFLALMSLRLLGRVREKGETDKDAVLDVIKSDLKQTVQEKFSVTSVRRLYRVAIYPISYWRRRK